MRIFTLFLVLLAAACSPQIGDECKSASDCSATGDRNCDRSLPGGYCTVNQCEADTCPDASKCVEWRYQDTRNSETLCMQSCSKNKDCRRGAGYRCVTVDDERLTDAEANPLARIIDLSDIDQNGKFCAYVAGE